MHEVCEIREFFNSNKRPLRLYKNVNQLVDHPDASYYSLKDAEEDVGNVMGKAKMLTGSSATLHTESNVPCSHTHLAVLHRRLLDTIPHTLHIQRVWP